MAQGALKMGQMQTKHIARSVEWLSREYAALDVRSEMEAEATRPPLVLSLVLVVRERRRIRSKARYLLQAHSKTSLNSVAARSSLAYT